MELYQSQDKPARWRRVLPKEDSYPLTVPRDPWVPQHGRNYAKVPFCSYETADPRIQKEPLL